MGRTNSHPARVPRLARRQDRPDALGEGRQLGAGPATEAATAHAGPTRHRPDHPRERLVQTETATGWLVGGSEGRVRGGWGGGVGSGWVGRWRDRGIGECWLEQAWWLVLGSVVLR